MTLPGPLTVENLRRHQWSLELAMTSSSDVFLLTIEDIGIELNDTPWWQPLKKFRLKTEWAACWRLALMFQQYADQQDEAFNVEQP